MTRKTADYLTFFLRNRKISTSIALLLITNITLAQSADSLTKFSSLKPEPPIPVELFAGGTGLNFQLVLSKPVVSGSRFGFLNVTTFFADYGNDTSKNEYISQSFLTTHLWKGFSINVGVSINYFSGFRPTAGLQYVFANKSLFVLLLPRFDLTETNNLETFGLIEYRPRFTKKWGLYTRVQNLLNYSTELGVHERSHTYFRAGASYTNFQFGIGTNIDFFGPEKISGTSFGVFFRVEIF